MTPGHFPSCISSSTLRRYMNFSSRRYKYASFCRLKSTTTILSRNLSFQQRKVRMIILSDTHGDDLKHVSLPSADVALHCGDLTNDSRPAELERTLAMLRAINVPLKLVIPGNHDFSLESGYWRRQQRQDRSSAPTQTSKAEDDADSKAFNLVDAKRSRVVASLLPATKFTNREGHCCAVDISSDGEHFVEWGAQTLFINAAVELRARPPRMPWMVDIDLPVADEDDITAAAETMYQLLV
ncbi:hypothetical protein BU24DRAFT_488167 [Aaosphaeria arxii CBS 175.79]|uniref:Calcineurin-like phosphoesterase domain-containing protein n=1 Tax=Aaosphaeria arxii CBS 175.79 TaxID=1450172 RepID=A0A6A5Y919_9PLEO|nr:uncharacterized protein BU24DRAFT_488167 [Aaosphaeria arxii CBS 175.79]KAF2021829.1 hypothetical protein BU24DRAFT_488167 [Aaosphaeria arxii CBS 175.79]